MPSARLLALAIVLVACTKDSPIQPTAAAEAGADVEQTMAAASRSNLTAFGSEEELDKFFDDLAKAQKRTAHRGAGGVEADNAPVATASAPALDKSKDESITNTQ